MALSYKAMGMDDLLKDTLRILRRNFPVSRYIAEAGA
jgi:outer membrane protein assembly factor BamD (BamD/ComL family)